MGLIDDAVGKPRKGNGADGKPRAEQHNENDKRLSRPPPYPPPQAGEGREGERREAARGHLEQIPVALKHSASLAVVAGLVPATPIIFAPPPYPPPQAGEGREGVAAGTSPAATLICDSKRSKSALGTLEWQL